MNEQVKQLKSKRNKLIVTAVIAGVVSLFAGLKACEYNSKILKLDQQQLDTKFAE